jgi:hypothetical protein
VLLALWSVLAGPAWAESIDPALVGVWEATTLTGVERPTTGGTGFRVTFSPDGVETVDYNRMAPLWVGGSDTQIFRGSAAARISTRDHRAHIEKMERQGVRYTMSTRSPTGEGPLPGLGPGGLGTSTDESYTCVGDRLTYRASAAVDRRPRHIVELTRVRDVPAGGPKAAEAPEPRLNGKTWLTSTQIIDRPQEVRGYWITAEQGVELTYLDIRAGRLTDNGIENRESGPESIDMTASGARRWAGRVYVCPKPMGTCPKLCRWTSGSLEFDKNLISCRGVWHGKKTKTDCSGFRDEPDSGAFTLKRFVGVSFVPVTPGKYMALVGAPAVGDQAAKFRAGVRIASQYQTMPWVKVTPESATGEVVLRDPAKGIYEFRTSRSGTHMVSFKLIDRDGSVVHVDRMQIDIPAMPGLGK